MILAIASGKGGTGKTTVAVALAQVAAAEGDGPVLYLDCDVEAPNGALFLRPKIDVRSEVGVPVPEVDRTKCTYCGRCAEVCAYNALSVVLDQVLVFDTLCHGCGSCTWNCPENAIREKLKLTGVVEEGRAGSVRFAHGKLNVGEAMATPVIRQLKKKVLPSKESDGLVIVDAPPGTACSVIESVRDADLVLLVTEPTPFGLHDLRQAAETVRDVLRIPVAVVLNRDGEGDRGIDEYCAREGIPILLRIPFDRAIAEAYSKGVSLVDAKPEYRRAIRDLIGVARTEVHSR